MSRRYLSRDLSLSGDVISAWLMSASFVVVLVRAYVGHVSWMAVWFAFTGAWFAWKLPVRDRANAAAQDEFTLVVDGEVFQVRRMPHG